MQIEEVIENGYWLFESQSVPSGGFCGDEYWVEMQNISDNIFGRVRTCDRQECIDAITAKVLEKYPDADKVWFSPDAQPFFDDAEYCCHCGEQVSFNHCDDNELEN